MDVHIPLVSVFVLVFQFTFAGLIALMIVSAIRRTIGPELWQQGFGI